MHNNGMSDGLNDEASDWSDVIRGRCLRCGSPQVTHHLLGMPTPESFESAPDWVDFGCTWAFPNRTCERCGHAWAIRAPENDVISDLTELLDLVGVSTLFGLSNEVSEYYEFDVLFDVEGDYALIPVINSVGLTLPYPFTTDEFRRDLDYLHEQQTECAEAQEAEDDAALYKNVRMARGKRLTDPDDRGDQV